MAEAANPYQAPRADVHEAPGETQPVRVFSVSGRIGRLRYIAFGAVFYLTIWIAAVVLAMMLGAQNAWLAIVLGWLAIMTIGFMLTIQRCHDFNTSGWLSLLLLVPLANLVFWFIPGTDGSNRYGAPTPPNGAWVIVGALVPLILVPIVGILAAVAIPAYQDYTYRAKISEVIMVGSSLRTPIAEYYMEKRKLPANVSDLGAPPGETKYGSVTIGPEGTVIMTLSPQMGSLRDRTIILRPELAGGQINRWDCTGGTLQPRYRPASCRAPQ